jgi:hypothetical protein
VGTSLALPARAADTDAGSSSAPAAKQAPTVSIPVKTLQSPRGGENGTVIMRVGNSAPIRVIIDTGFSGLITFPGAWDRQPSAIRLTDQLTTTEAGSLGRIRGLKASAPMTFSGVTTTTSVPFIALTKANPLLNQWTDAGVYGLLGIGTKGEGLVNPFSTLPGVLGLRWSLHFQRTVGTDRGRRGEIVLGELPPSESVMSLQLPFLGQDENGALLWNDQAADGCWRFGKRPETCLPTQLDAAFNVTRVFGKRVSRLPTNASGYLRTGTSVAFAEPGSAFAGVQYRAGNKPSRNSIRVIDRGKARVVVGNALYFDYIVTYNTVTGIVYISDPPSRKA